MFVFLCILLSSPLTLSQLSDKSQIHVTLNTETLKDTVNFVAVFLLTTLENSAEFGQGPNGDYFQRVRASRSTWAYPIKHFYAVVGLNDANTRILQNSKYCHNLTPHYRESTKLFTNDNKEEIYRCNGIKVLYLPYCDSSSWGPRGPCCRCEGAMRYYLHMTQLHVDYPKWFMFSDDDYYTRTYKLQGMLSKFDPLKPYAVTGDGSRSVRAGGDKHVARTHGLALWYHANCTVPCTHRSYWLGYAVFSYGAMRVMEEEVKQRGLERTCQIWATTHDVGLGIFNWYHAITSIPICCGDGHMGGGNEERGTFWHGVGKGHDAQGDVVWANDMMQTIWNNAAKESSWSTPDAHTFMQYEIKKGIEEALPSYPSAGFENSLFYRKMQFAEVMVKQMPEAQIAMHKELVIRRTDYNKQECTAEMEFHLKWREEHSDKYPLKSLGSNHVLNNGPGSTDLWNMIQHSSHEPKMCSEYWEAVANTPIKLSDLPLPPLDELERK